jgi:hypothetical protein
VEAVTPGERRSWATVAQRYLEPTQRMVDVGFAAERLDLYAELQDLRDPRQVVGQAVRGFLVQDW